MAKGLLLEVQEVQLGSHATATVPVGGTVIPVEDVTDFNQSGIIDVAGESQLSYVSVDPDASTLTLADPLTVQVDDLDPIRPIVGTQYATDRVAVVDLGGAGGTDSEAAGEPVRVPLSYEQRVSFPVRAFEPPIPVTVSDDLESVVSVPWLTPVLDGTMIDPDTLPDVSGGGPSDVPASTPALVVTGGPDFFVLRTEDASDTWAWIEYHVSTSETFTPIAGNTDTMVGSTRGVLVTNQLPDGSPYQLGTTYYFAAIAVNELGPSLSPSATVGTVLDPSAIQDIVTDEVTAGFVLAGEIQVGQMTISADAGIDIPTPKGGIHLPVDGSEALFSGALRTDDLYVEDHFQLNGANNSVGGKLVLEAFYGPPESPWVYDSYIDYSYKLPAPEAVSLSESLDGASWVVVPETADTVQFYDKTTGSLVDEWPQSVRYVYSAVSFEGYYFLAGLPPGSQSTRVWKLDSTGAEVDSWVAHTARPAGWIPLGVDMVAGELMTAITAEDGSHVRVKTWDVNGNQMTNLTWDTSALPWNPRLRRLQDIGRATFNGVTKRWIVLDRLLLVFDDATRLFDYSHAMRTRNLVYYGGEWIYHVGYEGGGYVITRVPALVPGGEQVDWQITAFDSDPGGTGTHETTPSEVHTHMRGEWAFARTRLAGLVADSGDPDSPNSVRLYANGHLQGTYGVDEVLNLGTLNTTGAAPPTVNEFEQIASGAGVIESRSSVDATPLIRLQGDGYARLGLFRAYPDQEWRLGGGGQSLTQAPGGPVMIWSTANESLIPLGDTGWITLPSQVSGVTVEYRVLTGWIRIRTYGSGTTDGKFITALVAPGGIPAEYRTDVQAWGGASIGGVQGMGRAMPDGSVDLWVANGNAQTGAIYLGISYPLDG